MWRSLVLSMGRPILMTVLNVAAQRVLASIDHTDKLAAPDKEVARGAVLQLVQEIGRELGAPTA